MPPPDALTPAATEVLTAALSLPAEQRVALADRLLEEVESAEVEPPPVPPQLLAELEREFSEIEAGRLETRTWEEVRTEVERIIRVEDASDRQNGVAEP